MEKIRTCAEATRLPLTGGSDAHETHRIGIYATLFTPPIFSETDLVEAIRAGRVLPV